MGLYVYTLSGLGDQSLTLRLGDLLPISDGQWEIGIKNIYILWEKDTKSGGLYYISSNYCQQPSLSAAQEVVYQETPLTNLVIPRVAVNSRKYIEVKERDNFIVNRPQEELRLKVRRIDGDDSTDLEGLALFVSVALRRLC